MIQIRMMKEDDMQALYGDEAVKPLLMTEAWGDIYCIIADEDGKIVGGLSGSIKGSEAALQVCAIGDVQTINGTVLTEGLIRSILYVLDKRNVVKAYVTMDVAEAIRQKIGFQSIGKGELPEWIKYDSDAGSIDIKEFLPRTAVGAKRIDPRCKRGILI